MIEIYGILVFLLGTIIGSFLNVVIFRMNTGRGLGGRSFCFTCRRTLSWHELIPIVSFINQRGKCHGCRSRISFQYPLVEMITGLVYVALFMKAFSLHMASSGANLWYLVFYMYIFSLLIVISVYDSKHFVISEKLVWLFNILALCSTVFVFTDTFSLRIPDASRLIAGPLVAFPFFLLWKITRGRGMGFGDVKLALGMGWILGVWYGLSAFVFSFWIGTIFVLCLYMHKKGKGLSRKTKIPFGPFICISLFLVFIFEVTIISIFNLF